MSSRAEDDIAGRVPERAIPAASPQPNVEAGGPLGRRFWLLVPVTGLAAGLGAGLLMQLLALVQRLAFGERGDTFLEAVQATGWGHRVLVLSLAGGLVVVGLRVLRHVGRHGGDLSAALWFGSGWLDFPRNLAQGVLSVVLVGLGTSLGREQAPKQVGAAFASLFATRAGLSGSRRRVLAAFGAGAGIAAVYDVPLGGALFALEVLLGTLALPLVAPAIATTAIATGTAWLLLPDRPVYAVPAYAVSPLPRRLRGGGGCAGAGDLRALRAPRRLRRHAAAQRLDGRDRSAARRFRGARTRRDPATAGARQREGCRATRLHGHAGVANPRGDGAGQATGHRGLSRLRRAGRPVHADRHLRSDARRAHGRRLGVPVARGTLPGPAP